MVTVINEIDKTLISSLQEFLNSKENDIRLIIRQYHNITEKKISSIQRKIHLSKEVCSHPLFLHEKRKTIENIIFDIEAGNDLSKYLSERSEQLDQYDLSLAHMGTHHFHLGDKAQTKGSRKGRVKGTKSLLFALVSDRDVYFLDILNHDIKKGFLNINMLRIIHNNWPELIETHRLKGAIGVSKKYSDEEAATLLENNINVIIELGENQVYMLPGMGATTAGTPMLVEMKTDRAIRCIQYIHSVVSQNSRKTASEIKKITGVESNIIRLRGRLRDGLLNVYDAGSECSFHIEGENVVITAPSEL